MFTEITLLFICDWKLFICACSALNSVDVNLDVTGIRWRGYLENNAASAPPS